MPPGGTRTHNLSRRAAADQRFDRAATEIGKPILYSKVNMGQEASGCVSKYRYGKDRIRAGWGVGEINTFFFF